MKTCCRFDVSVPETKAAVAVMMEVPSVPLQTGHWFYSYYYSPVKCNNKNFSNFLSHTNVLYNISNVLRNLNEKSIEKYRNL